MKKKHKRIHHSDSPDLFSNILGMPPTPFELGESVCEKSQILGI